MNKIRFIFTTFFVLSLIFSSPFSVFASSLATVDTNTATSITTTSATLNGVITDSGNDVVTARGFEYGLTTSYGSTTTETGIFSNAFGYVLGFGTQGSGNGQFDTLRGIKVDSLGNIYIVDSGNNRIQKFNSSGVFVSKFGTSGSGNGQFSNPDGIAIDSVGNIYVVDSGNRRIQKFDSSGTYVLQFGTQGSGNGQFDSPKAIAIDSLGNIYVSDTNSFNVQKFDSSGTYVLQFGTQGSGNGQFNSPESIAIDSSDNIYVVDRTNYRVQKFDSSGTYVSKFGTQGSGDGQFDEPRAISIDTSGNLYVLDSSDVGFMFPDGLFSVGNQRIQKFNSSGSYISQFVSFGSGNGQISNARGITLDSGNNIYINDSGNYRVEKLIASGTFSLSITGLSCGTTYSYRSYVTNGTGTSYGSDQTFTTSACPVVATNHTTGTSLPLRISNLLSMGKTDEAKKLQNQFPNFVNPNTPTVPALVLDKPLKPGKANPVPQVKILQKFLGLNDDGKFGPKTLKAVKEFQSKNLLVPDGVVGPKTVMVLNSLIK